MLQDQNTNDTTIQKPTNPEVQDNTENAAQDVSTDPSNVEADVAKPQAEEAKPEQDAQVDSSASLGDSGSTPEDPETLISDLRYQLDTANAELRVVQGRLAAFVALTAADKAKDQADSTDATAPVFDVAHSSDQTAPDSASEDKTDSSLSSPPDIDSSDNSEALAETASAEPVPEMAAAGEASALPVDGGV